MPFVYEDFLPEFMARADRAAARAVVAYGVNVSVETKQVTHKLTGTLARSVHAAPTGSPEGHEDDLERAQGNQDLLEYDFLPTRLPVGWAIEVGSWLPYACVEWVGRGHPGVTQGLEIARGRLDALVYEAYRQEGL